MSADGGAQMEKHDDPNRCCGREFCRTTLDLWRQQDRLLQDIASELGVEQPDQILPAIAESKRIEAAAFHAVMQYNSGTEESARAAINELDGLFQDDQPESAAPV